MNTIQIIYFGVAAVIAIACLVFLPKEDKKCFLYLGLSWGPLVFAIGIMAILINIKRVLCRKDTAEKEVFKERV